MLAGKEHGSDGMKNLLHGAQNKGRGKCGMENEGQ